MKMSAAQYVHLQRLKRRKQVMNYNLVLGVLFVTLFNGDLYLIMEDGEII